MPQITPVFLFGENRNGTTNFLNILSSSPDIFALKHSYHWGYMESGLLLKSLLFNRINNTYDYINFISVFKECDNFKLMNLDENILYEKKYENFYEMYFDLMDSAASKAGAKFWITKLTPRFAQCYDEYRKLIHTVNRRYKDAKFLCIERDYNKVVPSAINLSNVLSKKKRLLNSKLGQYTFAFGLCFSNANRYIFYKKIIKEKDGYLVKFEDFVAQTEGELIKINQYLGLDKYNYDKNNYKVNSSYYGRSGKIEISKTFIKASYLFCRIMSKAFPKLIIYLTERLN